MTYLKTLSLVHFRNYKKAHIELSPRLNIFVGKNGQGKTNCLEAIALLIAGKSFKGSPLKDLILENENQFCVHATFVKNQVEQSLAIEYSSEKKTLAHNQTTYNSFLPLIGLLQGVFFAGHHCELIKGSPQIRRRFLDLHSSQIDPLYLRHLQHFYKALKERNFLLKKKDSKALYIYEELMAKSIPYLIDVRLKNLNELKEYSTQIHQELTDGAEEIAFSYKSPFYLENLSELNTHSCLNLLQKNRERDFQMGFSLIGPHKDELLFYLQNHTAKKFASEGQIQTFMTSIYLAEYKRLQKKMEESPLFCIDDLGQNLDEFRQKKLFNYLENMGQVFVTIPKLTSYTPNCPHKIFIVDQGTITSS